MRPLRDLFSQTSTCNKSQHTKKRFCCWCAAFWLVLSWASSYSWNILDNKLREKNKQDAFTTSRHTLCSFIFRNPRWSFRHAGTGATVVRCEDCVQILMNVFVSSLFSNLHIREHHRAQRWAQLNTAKPFIDLLPRSCLPIQHLVFWHKTGSGHLSIQTMPKLSPTSILRKTRRTKHMPMEKDSLSQSNSVDRRFLSIG